jgi:membrane associated rhomboid family serine protease
MSGGGIMRNWRDIDTLPQNTDDGWSARDGWVEKAIIGKNAVEKLIKYWHPFSDWTVASPGNTTYLPMLDIEILKTEVFKSFTRRNYFSLLLLALASMLFGITNIIRPTGNSAQIFYATIITLQVALVDYLLVNRDIKKVRDRALFAAQIRKNERRTITTCTLLMLVIGLIQLFFADADAAMMAYGSVFSKLAEGEVWRILTGPFIHQDLAHWSTNFFVLCVAVVIGCAISPVHTTVVFFLACFTSMGASWAMSPYTHYDAVLGISGGIFGIAGYINSSALKYPELFPSHFFWTCSHLNLVDLYLPYVLNPDSSLTAHLSGLATGFAWGLLFRIRLTA